MGYFRELPEIAYQSPLSHRNSSRDYIIIKNIFRRVKLLDYLKFNRLEPLFPSVKIHKEHESLWTFAGNGLSICIDIPVARKNFMKTIYYKFVDSILNLKNTA